MNNIVFSYAGFGIRLIAFLVDFVLLSIVTTVIWAVLRIPISERNIILEFYPYVLFSNPFGSIMGWLYFALTESSSMQGSVGKYFVGIRVVDKNGNGITFTNATGRYFAKIISSAIFFIGYLLILTNQKKQSLHDILASTFVISDVKQRIEDDSDEIESVQNEQKDVISKPNLTNEKEILLDLFDKNVLTDEEYRSKLKQIDDREQVLFEKLVSDQKDKLENRNRLLFEEELNRRIQPLFSRLEELRKLNLLAEIELNEKKDQTEKKYRQELEREIESKQFFINKKVAKIKRSSLYGVEMMGLAKLESKRGKNDVIVKNKTTQIISIKTQDEWNEILGSDTSENYFLVED